MHALVTASVGLYRTTDNCYFLQVISDKNDFRNDYMIRLTQEEAEKISKEEFMVIDTWTEPTPPKFFETF